MVLLDQLLFSICVLKLLPSMYVALVYQLQSGLPKKKRSWERCGGLWNRWGKGDCFGELSLICSAPRTATVRATTYSTLWVLPRGQEESFKFYFKMFQVYCKCMYLLGSSCVHLWVFRCLHDRWIPRCCKQRFGSNVMLNWWVSLLPEMAPWCHVEKRSISTLYLIYSNNCWKKYVLVFWEKK